MEEASSFVDAIRAATGELRAGPHSPLRLNRIASRIDQMGRRVHGIDWSRGHEIGGCLTAAVGELSRAGGLPEAERAESVRQAIRQLETVLAHTAEGLRQPDAAPVKGLAAERAADEGR